MERERIYFALVYINYFFLYCEGHLFILVHKQALISLFYLVKAPANQATVCPEFSN